MSSFSYNDRTKSSSLKKIRVNKADIIKIDNLPFYLKEVTLKEIGKHINTPYLSQYSLGYVFANNIGKKTYDIKFVSPVESDIGQNPVIIRNEPAENVQEAYIQRVPIYKRMFEEMYHNHWLQMLTTELNIPVEKARAIEMVYLPLKLNQRDINDVVDLQARFYRMVTHHVDHAAYAAYGDYGRSMWLKKYNDTYYKELDHKLFASTLDDEENLEDSFYRKQKIVMDMKSRILNVSILQDSDV